MFKKKVVFQPSLFEELYLFLGGSSRDLCLDFIHHTYVMIFSFASFDPSKADDRICHPKLCQIGGLQINGTLIFQNII